MPLDPGTRLGNYEIVAPLGAGGMGEVYRARDLRLGREVALKVLPAEVAGDDDRLARFEREARTVAGLNHPNIVVLHSVEDVDGVRFLTMELVEGRGLDHHLTPGGLPVARVVDLGIAISDALVAAHGKGVVHRDLKPANVMLTRDGRVKVLDFGLAKLAMEDRVAAAEEAETQTTPLSREGSVSGTLPYMSPEQLRGGVVDTRSDLFALGIILYELFTGRRPFLGTSPADIASSILRDQPPPVTSLRSDVPPDVARIVGRCLDKDPDRRPQTARDVCNELDLARRVIESGTGAVAPQGMSTVPAGSDMPSIAVLPFENLGGNEDDEYFADGITEDVIAQLCKVRTLKVISRTSVMSFKGQKGNLLEIAARLKVANILEGSVRRIGERVRIVAHLVNPVSGHNHWAETYDRELKDIFAIQTEVALHIAEALRAELSPNERERIRREPTRDIQAYELYLRGRQCLLQFTVEGMHQSIEYFERAIERDPAYAPAYAGLAMANSELSEYGAQNREQVGASALSAAAKAVALDPELADAHSAQAHARMIFELDWQAVEAGFQRALELSPGDALSHDLYGRLCAGLGRFDEAIALHRRARELDPLVVRADLATSFLRAGRNEEAARIVAEAVELDPDHPRLRATLGWAQFRLGNVDQGVEELELATRLSPTEDIWLAQLGAIYGMAGETDKAREVLRRLEDPLRPTPSSSYFLSYVHTGLGDLERAMDCLERAYEHGGGPVYGIKGSFLLAPLHQHPRFLTLLKRMGQA